MRAQVLVSRISNSGAPRPKLGLSRVLLQATNSTSNDNAVATTDMCTHQQQGREERKEDIHAGPVSAQVDQPDRQHINFVKIQCCKHWLLFVLALAVVSLTRKLLPFSGVAIACLMHNTCDSRPKLGSQNVEDTVAQARAQNIDIKTRQVCRTWYDQGQVRSVWKTA